VSRDLSELLVSLALGALVIAGALQIHTAVTRQGQRQKEVAEVQQTLRVAARLVAAAVRNAGAGAPIVENDAGQCPGAPRPTAPVEWDGTVLRLVGARAAALSASGEGGGDLHVFGTAPIDLAEGDLFQVLTPEGACTREVTAVAERALQHQPARSSRCFNPAPADDKCLARCTAQEPCPLLRVPGAVEFRVEGGRFFTRTVPLGQPPPPWTAIAEGIERLEVERICGTKSCDVPQALRIQLTARGRSLMQVIALRNVS
jgi:hypothetical protein